MLELTNIAKRYDEQPALHPTSLNLEEAKTYVLIGPSGCGKSTLLKLMLGLVSPDSGTVSINRQRLTPHNAVKMRQRIGYVIQEGGLFPHLTARDNISLVARHLGWETSRIDSRVAEVNELTQLDDDCLDRFPAQLSGGQRQRVGLMRALMLDPDVLLLDEPLGALDPMIRQEMQTELRDVFRSLKKTVIIVTHDLHEAAFFADEIVLLRAGAVVQRGTISDLLESPADPFVTEFVSAQRTSLLGGEA